MRPKLWSMLLRKDTNRLRSILSAVAIAFALPADAYTCGGDGPEVTTASQCAFFAFYTHPRKMLPPDDRLEERIPLAGRLPVRSFAVVIGIDKYPRFPKDYVDLEPAAKDVDRLIPFLRDKQKFDEIIHLRNETVTKQNIDYVLGTYLPRQLDIFGKRARVLFVFVGHGAPGDRPNQPGFLVLENASDGNDYENLYPLRTLASMLTDVAGKSHHFLALLGSCYSGGIFANVQGGGDNMAFPGARGGHAVSSTRADDLAYGIDKEHGSIFFDIMLNGIESGRADVDYANWAALANGDLALLGGGIVRSGALVSHVSGRIGKLGLNPNTGQQFPQILYAPMIPADERGGGFFFLGPEAKPKIMASAKTAAEKDSVEVSVSDFDISGSSVVSRRDIKVFSPPDTYQVRGIDLSHFNTVTDWKKVAKQDIQFVYLKATESTAYNDRTFEANLKGASENRLKVGAYHVVGLCSDVQAQLANIKKFIKPFSRSLALPLALDVEWYGGPSRPQDRDCTKVDEVRQRLLELSRAVEREFGRPPVIHGSASAFGELIDDQFINFAVWLQDWRREPRSVDAKLSLPGDNPWTIWQHSSKGRVDGIDGEVDLDIFFGGSKEFLAFTSGLTNVALTAGPRSVGVAVQPPPSPNDIHIPSLPPSRWKRTEIFK